MPPSILYCTVNPGTAVTAGNVNAVLHVFVGAVITGAAGNITTLIMLLTTHDPFPMAPAVVLPQPDASMYLA